MTKKDKNLVCDALNQICAYIGAIAVILGDDDAHSRDRPKAPEAKQPEDSKPTDMPVTPTIEPIRTENVPDPEPAETTHEPAASTQQAENAIPTAEPEADPAPEPEATPKPEPPAKEIKYEDVREALATKSKAGYRAEVKALLTAHGIRQLSEADPGIYAQLLADAEEIGNG